MSRCLGSKKKLLREPKHTPGAYPRHPPTPKWKEFLHKLLVGGLGYAPGVCWKALRKLQTVSWDMKFTSWITACSSKYKNYRIHFQSKGVRVETLHDMARTDTTRSIGGWSCLHNFKSRPPRSRSKVRLHKSSTFEVTYPYILLCFKQKYSYFTEQ